MKIIVKKLDKYNKDNMKTFWKQLYKKKGPLLSCN